MAGSFAPVPVPQNGNMSFMPMLIPMSGGSVAGNQPVNGPIGNFVPGNMVEEKFDKQNHQNRFSIHDFYFYVLKNIVFQ